MVAKARAPPVSMSGKRAGLLAFCLGIAVPGREIDVSIVEVAPGHFSQPPEGILHAPLSERPVSSRLPGTTYPGPVRRPPQTRCDGLPDRRGVPSPAWRARVPPQLEGRAHGAGHCVLRQ